MWSGWVAGAARLGSLVVDRPATDAAFWVYLALELGLGAAALSSAHRSPARDHEAPV